MKKNNNVFLCEVSLLIFNSDVFDDNNNLLYHSGDCVHYWIFPQSGIGYSYYVCTSLVSRLDDNNIRSYLTLDKHTFKTLEKAIDFAKVEADKWLKLFFRNLDSVI